VKAVSLSSYLYFTHSANQNSDFSAVNYREAGIGFQSPFAYLVRIFSRQNPMNSRVLLALFIFFPVSLLAQVKISAKDINVLSATWQTWSPGTVQMESSPGGGRMYQIKFIMKKSGVFQFDSLVMVEGSLPVEVIKNTTRNYKGPFKKGETILLIAYQSSKEQLIRNSPAIRALITRQKLAAGAGLISYRAGTKRCLAAAGEFQRTTGNQENQ
jgi:hypothetical protein